MHAGVHISSGTVRRLLLKAGRKAKKTLKKQLLTHEMNKLEWAKNINIAL